MGVPLIIVERTAERRFVAELIGTKLWSAGPSVEYAVGALVLQSGWQFRIATLVVRTHDRGYCAVPVVTVGREGKP